MLPNNPLAQPQALYSGREETFFTPETLFLSIGIGQPEHSQDDAITTLIHEGIHWRQFQGTTFGAFCSWILHSQEMNTFRMFRELPDARKRDVLRKRAKGTPILQLSSDTWLPDLPISGADAERDPLALLRMVWYDHLFTYRYFLNSSNVRYQPDPPEQIFSGAISDAAVELSDKHPAWKSYKRADVQHFYTLDRVGKVEGLGRELTTKDLLEAAALANEVLLKAFTQERRLLLSDEAAADYQARRDSLTDEERGALPPHSIWSPREALDRGIFLESVQDELPTSYGHALQVFFGLSGLKPTRHESWLTALGLLDFTLNGPLPPLVMPNRRQPNWDELYPPARFLKASVAVRKCGELYASYGHQEVADFQARVADASGLSNPAEYAGDGVFDAQLPDFDRISKGSADELLGTPISYYHFLRYCQQALWRMRSRSLGMLVVPAWWIWRAMWADMSTAFSYAAGSNMTSPIIIAGDGEIEHSFGSTSSFSTWLAASRAVYYSTKDLMLGTGDPSFGAFPACLFRNGSGRLILRSIQNGLAISYNPWTGEDANSQTAKASRS